MESVCGCEVFWVEYDEKRSLKNIIGDNPRCLFVGGWSIPAFARFRDEVRLSGGKTIAMCDNNFVFSLRECVKAVRFRLMLRHKYDGYFVPGMSGVKLLRFYGAEPTKVVTGMYSADSTLFRNGLPLSERARRVLYVGQFIERKNVRRLVQAFQKANLDCKWRLDMYGSGPLKNELVQMTLNDDAVNIYDFCQPEELSLKYQEARIFCLPSLREHWGLVVHEAALSGCVLLLANKIGAAEDLLGKSNGWVFDPRNVSDMARILRTAMEMDDESLKIAQDESLSCAQSVSVGKFVCGIKRLIGNA
jgi:glycosyltransferase involved in cell wall biosynthesis